MPLSSKSVKPTGPMVSVLDDDTITVLCRQHPNVSASAASTAWRKARRTARERSRLRPLWSLGNETTRRVSDDDCRALVAMPYGCGVHRQPSIDAIDFLPRKCGCFLPEKGVFSGDTTARSIDVSQTTNLLRSPSPPETNGMSNEFNS
jgi:hypothetical protein